MAVRLEVQQVGEDVLARGRFAGAVGMECRRCLVPVTVEVDEPVSALFRRIWIRRRPRNRRFTFSGRARNWTCTGGAELAMLSGQ